MVAEGVKRRFLAEKKVFFAGESWQNNRPESPFRCGFRAVAGQELKTNQLEKCAAVKETRPYRHTGNDAE